MELKARRRGDHLTAQEIENIRASFVARHPIAMVARKINCSERNVSKYYGFFRAEGVEQLPTKGRCVTPVTKLKFLSGDTP